MAKTKNKTIQNPKPNKTSIFLCCFGPPPENDKAASITESSSITTTNKLGSDPPIIIQKHKKGTSSWLSWVRIRIRRKNPASKTVPLEAHYSKAKSKSKSTLLYKSQAPATNSPGPTQTFPVAPATPYYTPTQTRHGPSNNAEDTRQQGRGPPPTHQVKRQARQLLSSSSMQPPQTTSRKHGNARGSSSSSSSIHDAVAGMSVVVVTLVIMIFWGRICAILCTSAWLYCIPHFRKNDDYQNKKMKNDVGVVDLDSEEYKKRVIMEGLLERNNNHHRG